MVATTLLESWIPFRKSKTRARTITRMMSGDIEQLALSGNLDHNIGDHVGSFVAPVGGIAQVAVNFARFEHLDHVLGVFGTAEQVRQGLTIDILDPVFKSFGALGMSWLRQDGLADDQRPAAVQGGIPQQGGDTLHERSGSHFEYLHFVHCAVGIVEHIVNGPGKGEYIFPVKGGDEGLIQLRDQDAPDFVGLFFV